MPSRKHVKPLPNFSFIPAEFEPKETSWLKTHSGAARSHAAYWGGTAKYKRQDKKQMAGQQSNAITSLSNTDTWSSSCDDSTPDSGCLAAPTSPRRGLTTSKNARAGSLSPGPQSTLSRYVEPNHLRYLPPAISETRVTRSPFAAVFALSTFEFCGERFVQQFFMLNHEDYPAMFSGYQLLSYAYHMALTGHGTQTMLLELKGQVIRRICAKMNSSDDLLSPQYLTAILALGSPIVCLVSQDLPKGMSMWEYLNASMMEDYLCCAKESVDTAQRALDERIVHRKAMCRLFFQCNAIFQDRDSLALLQYLSNHINISMAIESANKLDTPLVGVGDLLPAISLGETSAIPDHWASPLTCQRVVEESTTNIETQMLQLAGLIQRWLETFLDGDSHELVPTKEILEERMNLRQRIERFGSVAKVSDIEAEAMYYCCLWAGLILLAVEKLSIPINVAAKQVRIKPRLIRLLRMTDLTNLWGIRKGLLFWVTAICHFCVVGQCFPLMCTTLFARFTQEMSMSDICLEIAIKPLKRLRQFERLCCRPDRSIQAVAACS